MGDPWDHWHGTPWAELDAKVERMNRAVWAAIAGLALAGAVLAGCVGVVIFG